MKKVYSRICRAYLWIIQQLGGFVLIEHVDQEKHSSRFATVFSISPHTGAARPLLQFTAKFAKPQKIRRREEIFNFPRTKALYVGGREKPFGKTLLKVYNENPLVNKNRVYFI